MCYWPDGKTRKIESVMKVRRVSPRILSMDWELLRKTVTIISVCGLKVKAIKQRKKCFIMILRPQCNQEKNNILS